MSEQRPPDIGLRLAMMLLDHVIFSFTIAFMVMPFWFYFIFNTVSQARAGELPPVFFEHFWLLGLVYVFALAFYLNKDALDGRSPGKRIIKARVINLKTGETAGPLRCFARNLTLWLWPIEALMVLINQDRRRIGDYLAGTQVVVRTEDEAAGPVRWGQVALSYGVGVLSLSAVLLPFFLLFQKMGEGMQHEFSRSGDSYHYFESEGEENVPPLPDEYNEELPDALLPVVRDATRGVADTVHTVNVYERGQNMFIEIVGELPDQSLFDNAAAQRVLAGRVRAALEENELLAGKPVAGRLRLFYGARDLTIPF